MFWTDEDIQPSVDLAEKIFGKNSQSNIFLFTILIKNVKIR